jgi:hypothetical protein
MVHLPPLVATVRALPPGLFWLGPTPGAAPAAAPRAGCCGSLGRLPMPVPLLSPPAAGRRVPAGPCWWGPLPVAVAAAPPRATLPFYLFSANAAVGGNAKRRSRRAMFVWLQQVRQALIGSAL